MALDPSISLQVRPPAPPTVQIQSPLEQVGQVLSLRGLMQQGELRNLQMQQAQQEIAQQQREIQDQQNLATWVKQNQGRPDLTGQDIVTGNPNAAGLKFATAWTAQKTAELTQHKAFLENAFEEARTDDRIYNSVTDDKSKTAAVAELVRLKRIDGDMGAHLLAIPYDSPEFKGIQQRVAAQSLDRLQRINAAKAEVERQIAETTKSATIAGTQAESAKKIVDAAQAQRAQDAALLAPIFDKSPEAGAAAVAQLAKEDPKRAAPFLDAKTAHDVRWRGLTAEQQQTASQAEAGTELADLDINGKPHRVLINKQTGNVVKDLGEAGYKPTEPSPTAATALLDREVTRFAKPHEKSVADANSQLEKIAEARAMINGPAAAQALGIPKVLVAAVGGQGSGVRVTQAELASIAKARGIVGDVEGFLNKLSGAGSLTSEQQRQLTQVLDDVAERVRQKQAIANEALDRINSAGTREEIIAIDREMRKRLADMEKGAPPPPAGKTISGLPRQSGGPTLPPGPEPRIVPGGRQEPTIDSMRTAPPGAPAIGTEVFYKGKRHVYMGGDPNLESNWQVK